jgi:wyosine [tRNA(Phe)-imidazoG37] synthetase (radical SAM superfamily)
MLVALQRGILYGPINSRRLGRSLGINLMPVDFKLCSFNCVYCHFGWTGEHTMDPGRYVKDLPTFSEVVKAVEKAARSSMAFDFLTFSGNGEPTMHPQFADLVEAVVGIRNRYRPEVTIALLSNSTGLSRREVRESIPKIDFPAFKLDAGTEKKFKAINKPAKGTNFAVILNTLISMEDIYIQTMLLGGSPCNTTEDDLVAYYEVISRIQPKEVHIYSIDRPVPNTGIALVSPRRLEEIALRGQKETGLRIRAFYPAQSSS